MKNQFPKVAMAVHAHPDDTEMLSSGTMMLLKEKGYRLVIVTLTAGGMGGVGSTEEKTIAQRKEEALQAAAEIGADYYCLDERDGYLFDTAEVRMRLLELIRREQAGILFTHLPFDYHADHRASSQICEAAAILASLENAPVKAAPLETTPLLYHTATLGSTDPLGAPIIKPHFAVNISGINEQKMKMLGHHKSQIDLMRRMHKMDNFFEEVSKQGREWGAMYGVEHAEAFWQHLGGGFQKDPLIQKELAPYILTGETK